MKKTTLYLANLYLAVTTLVSPCVTITEAHAFPIGKQATFKTPEDAVSALGVAVHAQDIDALHQLFGREGDAVLSSGDPVEDSAGLARFADLYSQKAALEKETDSRYALIVGPEDWPFPIPLIASASGWRFDTKAGKEEILNRRIGRNELWTIDACKAYVAAQRAYAARDQDGDGYREYAQMMLSNRGWHNGLFWTRKPGEAPSPLGPIVAHAVAAGYQMKESGERIPVHGYFFKILMAQGPNAPGGKKSYVTTGGHMTEGFALVAYPAMWGNSGVMTFLVNQDGQVYQKDLGPKSTRTGEPMTAYNPDSSWQAVH
jgi:hypothetical protein